MYKVLNGGLNDIISKDDFIKSVLKWYKESLYQDKENENSGASDPGKDSAAGGSTSGFSEPSELASGSSTNSMEEMFHGSNFVTNEQIFTNEDSVDETYLNDSGSSQTDLRLVKSLQIEMTTLLRKNEYLENINNSLLGQVASLEDTVAKKQEDSENYKTQLVQIKNRLELKIQKYNESEERINLVTEEIKSMTKQLSEYEKENKKLNATISINEKKLESSLNENIENKFKIEQLKNKLKEITDTCNNSTKLIEHERESYKYKEKEREIAWLELVNENQRLQQLLGSNISYSEDLEQRLQMALKELSDLKTAQMKENFQTDSSSSILGIDNKAFWDENCFPGGTIPFQASLLAELKDELESNESKSCCVCNRNTQVNLNSVDTVDADKRLNFGMKEKATMTNLRLTDDCLKEAIITKSRTFLLLKPVRSLKKWGSLFGILLIFGIFLYFHIFFTHPRLNYSHKPKYYSHLVFGLLHVTVETLDKFIPVK